MKTPQVVKKQYGFLIIIPLILIVVIGFLGAVAAYIYVDTAKSVTSIISSDQAFYIAASGLETAKRDLIVNGVNCTQMNPSSSAYTNVPLFTGYYSVNGTINNVTGSLKYAISNSTVTIPLVNVSSFLSSGIVRIGDEILSYSGKDPDNNWLNNAVRGIAGTANTTHIATATVAQNVCVLTATAGVPNLNKSSGKRVLQQQVMLGFGNGIGVPGQVLPNSIQPVVVSGSLQGCLDGKASVLIDASATITDNYNSSPGCAIASAGCIDQKGGAATYNCQGVSYPCKIGSLYGTACYSDPAIAAQPFFNYFFTDSLDTMKSNAYYPPAWWFDPDWYINNAAISHDLIRIGFGFGPVTLTGNVLTSETTSKTLIIDGDLNLANVNIGSSTSPVKIIVTGNLLNQSGWGNIYGFLYVQGRTILPFETCQYNLCVSTSSFHIYGMMATAGTAYIKNSDVLIFDSNTLRYLGLLAGSPPIISTPEVFQ